MVCTPCALAAASFSGSFFPILAEPHRQPVTSTGCPKNMEATPNYCIQTLQPASRFDPRSFRTLVQEKHRITVACPTGQFKKGRCQVQLMAQKILHPKGEN